jgi:hypothetical protein
MQITITRRLAIGLTILVVLSAGTGYFLSRVTDPPSVTGSRYDSIVKYCTPIGTGNLPPPFNQWLPAQYRNGSYTLYSCKN